MSDICREMKEQTNLKMNGYELLEPFQNKNAGFSRWTYALRDNKIYFLKEFLDPIYPMAEDLSEEFVKESILACKEYEEKKKRLYHAVNLAADGNIMRVHEFFRCDSHYYISTLKVDGEYVSLDEIKNASEEDKILLWKTLMHSLKNLHAYEIVHSDLKLSNVLVCKSVTGKYVAKLIDFGCSFFESDPPESDEELGGDQVYLAPEIFLFMCGEPVELTCKADVFSLGLLLHELYTGKLPEFDHTEYDYAYEAILDGQELLVSEEISPIYRYLIRNLLLKDPEERMDLETACKILFIDEENSEDEEDVAGEEMTKITGSIDKVHTSGQKNQFGLYVPGDL